MERRKEKVVNLFDLFSFAEWSKLNAIAFGFYSIVQLLLIVRLVIKGRGQLLSFKLKVTGHWFLSKFILLDFLFMSISNLLASYWYILLGFSIVLKSLSTLGLASFIIIMNDIKRLDI